MEEKEIGSNLAEMNEIFNNKTFKYRINGFAHACGMDNINVTKNSMVLSSPSKSRNDAEHTYFIALNKDEIFGKSVTLTGQYDDLHFTFINQFDKEKLDSRIIDLPFFISLNKTIDNNTYKFDIETFDGTMTKFSLDKTREFKDRSLRDSVSFYANVLDFSKVLKIVKSFVYNPELTFSVYNEIMKSKRVTFTNSELSRTAMKDDNLDKPMSKLVKKIKILTNSD